MTADSPIVVSVDGSPSSAGAVWWAAETAARHHTHDAAAGADCRSDQPAAGGERSHRDAALPSPTAAPRPRSPRHQPGRRPSIPSKPVINVYSRCPFSPIVPCQGRRRSPSPNARSTTPHRWTRAGHRSIHLERH